MLDAGLGLDVEISNEVLVAVAVLKSRL